MNIHLMFGMNIVKELAAKWQDNYSFQDSFNK